MARSYSVPPTGYELVDPTTGAVVLSLTCLPGFDALVALIDSPPEGRSGTPELTAYGSADADRYFNGWSVQESRDLRVRRLADGREVDLSGCFVRERRYSGPHGTYAIAVNM